VEKRGNATEEKGNRIKVKMPASRLGRHKFPPALLRLPKEVSEEAGAVCGAHGRMVAGSKANRWNQRHAERPKSGGTRAVSPARIANASAIRKGRGVSMSEIPSADALNLFASWERQNRKLAVLGSNPACVISLRNARVTLCLDDLLQLTHAEDDILRFFVRGALFSPADPKDFPEESSAWFAEFEQGVQIRFVNVEMQWFIFPEREKIPV
jgi:hypothetical protein